MCDRNKINNHCHLEPRAIASGCKDLFNKCRVCCEVMELKRDRTKPLYVIARRKFISDEAIFQAVLRAVQRLLNRCCKNVEDCHVGVSHLLAMTPITLTLVLVLFMNLSTSFAATIVNSGNCGSDCHWTFDDSGRLNITGTGPMNDYHDYTYDAERDIDYYADVPWNDYLTSVTSVNVSDGITNIGEGAFSGAKNLQSVSGMKDVTMISGDAFMGASSLTSVDLPNVTKIENWAFGASGLTKVNMPNVTEIGSYAFGGVGLKTLEAPKLEKIVDTAFFNTDIEYVNIPNALYCNPDCDAHIDEYFCSGVFGESPICQGGTNNSKKECIYENDNLICNACGDKFAKSGVGCVEDCGTGYTPDSNTKQCVKNSAPAGSPTPGTVTQPTAASCASGGKVLQGKECVASCGSSFRLNDGECDRIRYTPAEAAQYLKDTDNEIIMTFKVNR